MGRHPPPHSRSIYEGQYFAPPVAPPAAPPIAPPESTLMSLLTDATPSVALAISVAFWASCSDFTVPPRLTVPCSVLTVMSFPCMSRSDDSLAFTLAVIVVSLTAPFALFIIDPLSCAGAAGAPGAPADPAAQVAAGTSIAPATKTAVAS